MKLLPKQHCPAISSGIKVFLGVTEEHRMKPVLDFSSAEAETPIQRFLWITLYSAVQEKASQVVLELTSRKAGRLVSERSEFPVELGISEEIQALLDKLDAAKC